MCFIVLYGICQVPAETVPCSYGRRSLVYPTVDKKIIASGSQCLCGGELSQGLPSLSFGLTVSRKTFFQRGKNFQEDSRVICLLFWTDNHIFFLTNHHLRQG